MTLPIIPVIGSSGSYKLLAPFDTYALNGEEYTCRAVRSLSDYLVNNETPKVDIYEKYGLEESVWEEDVKSNAYIVSLQSRSGHLLSVPARYIESYPNVNGVLYRTVMIGIALPSLPVSQDLSALMETLRDVTENALGVNAIAKLVETSKPVLISSDIHETKQLERAIASGGQTTLSSQLLAAQQREQTLLTKVAALEEYIKTHHVP